MATIPATFELFYSGAWHEVPAYTRDEVSLTRGRGPESQSTPPTEATFTIDNRTGDYNPTNPESPLFGLAGRNTPCRISVDDAVELYGEIASWAPGRSIEPVSGTRGDAWVKVTVAGIRRRLGQGRYQLKSAHQRHLDGLATLYWPLDEGPGSTVGRLAVGTGGDFRRHASSGDGTLNFGSGDLAPWLEKGLVLTGQCGIRAVDFAVVPTTQLGFTWVTRGVSGTSQVRFFDAAGETTIASVTSYASLSEVDVNVMGTTTGVVETEPFLDGPHLWYLQLEESGANVVWELYLDDLPTPIQTGTTTSVSLATVGIADIIYNTDQATDTFTLSHLAVFTSFPTIVTDYYGLIGETAAARFARLCTEEGLAYTVLGTSADSEPMGPQYPGTLLEHIDEIEAVDGAMVIDHQSQRGLVMLCGNYLYTKDAALTIDYGNEELAPSSDPVLDDLHVRNDITVKRRDGGQYRVEQATGPNNIQDPEDDPQGVGRVPDDPTVNCENDAALPHHAGWRLHIGTVDKLRWPQVTLDLVATPSLTPPDIGDRIIITNLPLSVAPEDADLLVIGYTQTIGPATRIIEYVTVPYEPYKVGVYADSSTTDPSRYDTSGSELASQFIAGTDTSMSVSITSGPLWTTTGSQFPFNIRCGGVVFRVTAISGASSPQTFTVARDPINGATKTLASGTALSLADPAYYAR